MVRFLKDYLLLFLMVAGFLAAIVLTALHPGVSLDPGMRAAPGERAVIKVKDGNFLLYGVDMALTPEEQKKGLMGRESLPANYGMLFLFPGEEERRFWMKDTLVPLDMVFIKNDGSIHRIHHSARPGDETMIPSNGPVRAVLEVSGGEMEKYNVQPGDVVIHPVFGNMGLLPAE